jgi:malate dehydrogenase (oxaloacetate-decarboxylating)(NADP+)
MPNVDAANITYNAIKILADCIAIGPILLGVAKPVHILTNAATTRGIMNITALSSIGAQIFQSENPDQFLKQENML